MPQKRHKNHSISEISGKRVLIHYYLFNGEWMGGGEYLPLLFIAELQKRGCQVTLTLDQESDVASVARNYNVDINFQELHMELIRCPKTVSSANRITFCRFTKLGNWQQLLKKQMFVSRRATYSFSGNRPIILWFKCVSSETSRFPITSFIIPRQRASLSLCENYGLFSPKPSCDRSLA